VTVLLAALTDALPDSGWLDGIHLDGSDLMISGFAPAAADLIAALERSGSFTNVRFAAAVVHDPARRAERFQIAASFKAAKR
jgi:Tfp pilus assembly protein PilN